MRYLPQTEKSRAEMLSAIGVKTVDDLFADIPKAAWVKGKVALPDHQGEVAIERAMNAFASQNRPASTGAFFLGAGVYFHHVPATVDYIIQRSEFLTAYTPYQPEIAQGTLQAVFEFQTFIAQMTGQDVANASMYDGATACAEAALMAMRVTGRKKVTVGTALHPHYRDVLNSYLGNLEGAAVQDTLDGESACVIVQSPDFFGTPHAYDAWRKKCDETGALLVVVINEIVSLGLLPAPESADIVCGEAQSIGLPMSYGGPHLGFFACREKYLRQMPGRLCGRTVDADGKPSFVLTLSTREQHIRREKATSNICTNQGLCALAFTVHMALLGEDGFKTLARINHERATALADAVSSIKGVKIINTAFFNEFEIEIGKNAQSVIDELARRNVIAGYATGEKRLLITATEMTTDDDIATLIAALKEVL